jgi:hypothetical protein
MFNMTEEVCDMGQKSNYMLGGSYVTLYIQ